MAVIQTLNQSEGQAKLYTSRYLDNAAAVAAVHTPGFSPRKVIVFNQTDSIRYEWQDGNLPGTYTQTLANGTQSLVTGGANLSVAVGPGQQPTITHAVVTNKQYSVEAFA